PGSHYAIEVAMASAYRPSSTTDIPRTGPLMAPKLEVLAGDLHCPVTPPDHRVEASRSPAETVDLARDEGLDFVVLTPHVASRFFLDEAQREAVLASRQDLQRELSARSNGRTLFIIG